jgi:hypothetical protein
VQNAPKLTIDSLTLYAGNAQALVSVTPPADLAALSAGLSGTTGQASLSLSADDTVMVRNLPQQVFLVLQYHFGVS